MDSLHPSDADIQVADPSILVLYGNYMGFNLKEIEQDVDAMDEQDAIDDDPSVVFRQQPPKKTEKEIEEEEEQEEQEKEAEEFHDINDDLFEDLEEEQPLERQQKRQRPHAIERQPKRRKQNYPLNRHSEEDDEEEYQGVMNVQQNDEEQQMDPASPIVLTPAQQIALFRAKQQLRCANNNALIRERIKQTEPDFFDNMNLSIMTYDQILDKRRDAKTALSVYNAVGGIYRQYDVIAKVIDAIGKYGFGFEGNAMPKIQSLFHEQMALQTFEKLGKVNPFVHSKVSTMDRILELAQPAAEALYEIHDAAKTQQRLKKLANKPVNAEALARYKQMLESVG